VALWSVNDVVVAVVPEDDLAVLPMERHAILLVYIGLIHLGIPLPAHSMGLETSMSGVLPESMDTLNDGCRKLRRLRLNESLELIGDY
jgi:hypothetical protein